MRRDANVDDVKRLFGEVEAAIGAPEVVVYNASGRVRGPFVDLDPAEVERAITITAYGGFLVAQEAGAGCCRRITARFFLPALRRA